MKSLGCETGDTELLKLIEKGTPEKDKLLQQIYTSIHQPGIIPLREEWQRGL